MEQDTVDKFTFAKFAEEFSIKLPEQDTNTFRFGKVPGVYTFQDVVSRIEDARLPDLYFMGVIGSVDKVFSYVANLNPKRAFLFDEKPQRIPHLGLRLSVLKHSKKVSDNYLNMICADPEAKKLLLNMDRDEMLAFINNLLDVNPDEVVRQGSGFLEDLGYEHPSRYIQELFRGSAEDTKFSQRRHFAVECFQSMEKAEKRFGKDLAWTRRGNFTKMWQYAWSNKIKGFYSDLYDGFRGTAKMIVEAYGIRNLAVHISNIGEEEEYPLVKPMSLSDTFGDLPESLDNLIVLAERDHGTPHHHIWIPYK
jgi:hypothetical protein